jgi:large subunit ribosomal protein L18
MGIRSRADVRRSIHGRIRKKVSGTTERPRLAVYRSTKHIYAQVIDDVTGKTLVSASSVEKDLKGSGGSNIKAAEVIGKAIAERAQKAGITVVVYDRGGFIYHGRVKALLDATRAAGLNPNEEGDSKEKPSGKKAKAAKAEAPAKKAPAKKKPKAKKEAAEDKASDEAKPPKTDKKPVVKEESADEKTEAKSEEKEESNDQKSADVESAENSDE